MKTCESPLYHEELECQRAAPQFAAITKNTIRPSALQPAVPPAVAHDTSVAQGCPPVVAAAVCSEEAMSVCVCPHHHSHELADPLEPSSTHSCEHLKARKTGAQLRDNRRSAKNDAKCLKKPFITTITQLLKVAYPSLSTTKRPQTLAMNGI